MEFINNPQLELAFDYVQYTNTNIFLTGKAGTGKTTFLHNLKRYSPKRMVVVAPTGVAAINAGGVTIHSFFQLPFGPHVPQDTLSDNQASQAQQHRFSKDKLKIIRSLDLLVIDEISMVRADMLDAVDEVLRRFRDRNKPFGGVQLLMIGDLQQLAPVVKDDEWNLLKSYYDTAFFFSSRALQKTQHVSIELTHIFRQSDASFIEILNRVRENNIDTQTLEKLNARYIHNFNPKDEEGYITLTTHNAQSQHINTQKLQQLNAKSKTYTATIKDDFPEYLYPNEFELTLKVGAQVMFVKNDSNADKRYFNGKIGKVSGLDKDTITVKCPGDDAEITVSPAEWQNIKYTVDDATKEITESVIGSFTQYPLKLAWAITIHKSQGLTFERAIIDANAAFAHGQVYVALSRCKTLEGLVLSSKVSHQCIKSDSSVLQFTKAVEENQPGKEELNQSKREYIKLLLMELFDFIPIQRRLNYCLKLINEHLSVLVGSLGNNFAMMSNHLHDNVITVSQKFSVQVQQLLASSEEIEHNAMLQERVMKACTYFEDKTKTELLHVLETCSVDCDNKTARTAISDAIDKLLEETLVKRACLQACTAGFAVKAYLDARAKATITEVVNKPTIKRKETPLSDFAKDTPLFNYLRQWRNNKAEELDVPHYMILHQKTLLSLSERMPASIKEVAAVKGIGNAKAKQFGGEIIEIINQYCKDNNIEREAFIDIPEEKETRVKSTKLDTKRLSFDMFRAGKTITDIAEERAMAATTIEGHLSVYIESGELSVAELLSDDKIAFITDYFACHKTQSLKEAKDTLGETVSYGEIKLVLSHLKWLENG